MKKQILISTAMISLLLSCNSTEKNDLAILKQVPVMSLKTSSIEVPQIYVADIQAVKRVEIRPNTDGFIENIYVDEGQQVKKGQVLFSLNAAEHSQNLRNAQANLKEAQALQKMSVYEINRVSRIVKKDIVSSVKLDQVKAEKEVADMKIHQAQAQLEQARINMSYATITAPFDGVIDKIPYKKGSLVSPESLLTSVTDVSDIFVYFSLSEKEYLQYQKNKLKGKKDLQLDEIELILADGSVYSHKGKVEAVGADFNKGTGSISFRASFANPDGLLKHGSTGKITIPMPMDNIILIPQKSTFEIQDFTYVYVVDSNNKVQARSFTPLTRYGEYYVTKDFDKNTKIVYEGIQLVKDGAMIQPNMINVKSIVSNHTIKKSN